MIEVSTLVTLKTFANSIEAPHSTIMLWCNNKLSQFIKRPKNVEFERRMILFVIIEGKRFDDIKRTRLTKQIYTDLFKRK